MRTFHFQKRHTGLSPSGQPMWRLGLRIGYWPCLQGYFIEVDLGAHRYCWWYGTPSYK